MAHEYRHFIKKLVETIEHFTENRQSSKACNV